MPMAMNDLGYNCVTLGSELILNYLSHERFVAIPDKAPHQGILLQTR